MKQISRLIAWGIIPLLAFILALQNNVLNNNYSDLRLTPVYSVVYIIFGFIMAMYFFFVLYYLIKKESLAIFYRSLLWISLAVFLLGIILPYHPQGNDVSSLRHVDFVLLAMALYIVTLIRYLASNEMILLRKQRFLMVFLIGAGMILLFSQKVNSLLELWGAIGMSVLLEDLYEKEKNFDI